MADIMLWQAFIFACAIGPGTEYKEQCFAMRESFPVLQSGHFNMVPGPCLLWLDNQTRAASGLDIKVASCRLKTANKEIEK